jgi:hypothetical protein
MSVPAARVLGRFSDSRARWPRGEVTFLLAVASQPSKRTSAFLTAFVPVYRCGAVPDSHRVPLAPHHRVEEPKTGGGIRRSGIACQQLHPHRDDLMELSQKVEAHSKDTLTLQPATAIAKQG